MKKILYLSNYLLLLQSVYAQFISHGPVIGSVAADSARIYIKTRQPQTVSIQYDTLADFSNPNTQTDSTRIIADNTTIFNLRNLTPNTRYYIRFQVNSRFDSLKASFRTFPPIGAVTNFEFATGSCHETPNMKAFDAIAALKPAFFVHTGDFTYPSYQLNNSYPSDYQTVTIAWRKRYEEPRLKELLYQTPIAYVPDDDDGYSTCRDYWEGYQLDSVNTGIATKYINRITSEPVHPQARSNTFKAYTEFFPGYQLADTAEALHHKFTYGNCDFFFVDTRSGSSSLTAAFKYDSVDNRWSYQPDTNATIIGRKQLDWLKQSLQASNADWKFICSGLPFNKSYRRIIQLGMNLQSLPFSLGSIKGTGFALAMAFARYWAGAPAEQDELLNFIANQQLKNIIILSGDTHHNVVDNGINAGLPELNASGLSVTDTRLAYYMNQFAPLLGQPLVIDSLWNGGGNGLNNNNFKNGFGHVQVFGKDSVILCTRDEDGLPMGCVTIRSNQLNQRFNNDPHFTKPIEVLPNPATQELTLLFNSTPPPAITAELYNSEGIRIQSWQQQLTSQTLSLSVAGIINGKYWLKINTYQPIPILILNR